MKLSRINFINEINENSLNIGGGLKIIKILNFFYFFIF
jgi:hypothetical protein